MAKKLKDATILDIIPPVLRSDPQVIAFSDAFQAQFQRLLEVSDIEKIYYSIDTLPDWVLDVLALEWQTQHYDQTYTTEEKARLIKGTLMWYVHAGTKGAVEDLADTVFGDGTEVVEYADAGDSTMQPFEFDIRTPAAGSAEAYAEFAEVIQAAQNIRSHLRKVYKYDLAQAPWYIGIKSQSPTRTITAGLER